MESKHDHDKASFQKHWRPWLQMWKKSSRLHNKISVGTPGLQHILSASWCTLLVWRQIKMKSLRDNTSWCAPAEGQVREARRELPARPGNQGETATTQKLDQRFKKCFDLKPWYCNLLDPYDSWFCKGTCSILFTIEHKWETAEQLVVSVFFGPVHPSTLSTILTGMESLTMSEAANEW